jgi:hypothetical protein
MDDTILSAVALVAWCLWLYGCWLGWLHATERAFRAGERVGGEALGFILGALLIPVAFATLLVGTFLLAEGFGAMLD